MLEIRNLVKVYPGPVAALQGVSLDVGQGMFGLLGPNGAGKTTLMRVVAGLLEPTSGTVHFDGEDIVADPRRIRRQLGYLPQDFGFYPHLTGESMLRFLLVLKGVEAPQGVKRLAAELLDRVNLSYAAKRKVKGYSGGMRQRLGIAQALAGDPRLLVVDEPTAGLDPEERLRFYRLLAELAEDRTVLLSTHIVDDISVLCPRVAIMYGWPLRRRHDPGRGPGPPRGHDLPGRRGEGGPRRGRPRLPGHPGDPHRGPQPGAHPPPRGPAAGRLRGVPTHPGGRLPPPRAGPRHARQRCREPVRRRRERGVNP
ncbi:ABC transporter ATP-binding protein [Candidatus Palauibacter sp.]|uniref:ABC transporter ATP-binding protein n=1 Tax=Candidatus Palauibacter sp. TaxID=3101350 RepID=UPI003B018E84